MVKIFTIPKYREETTLNEFWIEKRAASKGTKKRLRNWKRKPKKRKGKWKANENRIGLALEHINLKGKGFFLVGESKGKKMNTKIYILFPITKESAVM